jgi:hypothetical protein
MAERTTARTFSSPPAVKPGGFGETVWAVAGLAQATARRTIGVRNRPDIGHLVRAGRKGDRYRQYIDPALRVLTGLPVVGTLDAGRSVCAEGGSRMSAQIQIIIGPDKGQSFHLKPGGTLQIGRSQSTDTHLTDATVSRNHCEIIFDGQRATLVNLSSKGTLLNGLAVAQEELRHGDVIRLGETELRFSLTALSDAETLLQPFVKPQDPPSAR